MGLVRKSQVSRYLPLLLFLASPLCEQSPSSSIAGGDSAALRGQRVQANQAQALTRIAIQML